MHMVYLFCSHAWLPVLHECAKQAMEVYRHGKNIILLAIPGWRFRKSGWGNKQYVPHNISVRWSVLPLSLLAMSTMFFIRPFCYCQTINWTCVHTVTSYDGRLTDFTCKLIFYSIGVHFLKTDSSHASSNLADLAWDLRSSFQKIV